MVDELVLDQTQIHHLVQQVAQTGVVRIMFFFTAILVRSVLTDACYRIDCSKSLLKT